MHSGIAIGKLQSGYGLLLMLPTFPSAAGQLACSLHLRLAAAECAGESWRVHQFGKDEENSPLCTALSMSTALSELGWPLLITGHWLTGHSEGPTESNSFSNESTLITAKGREGREEGEQCPVTSGNKRVELFP